VPEFWAQIEQTAASYPELTVGAAVHNIFVQRWETSSVAAASWLAESTGSCICADGPGRLSKSPEDTGIQACCRVAEDRHNRAAAIACARAVVGLGNVPKVWILSAINRVRHLEGGS
jgi:hypothetical protein